MALSIADLRAQRSKDFGSITSALNKKSEYARDDEGFWKLEPDKAGNASAEIRFLPKHPDDELPYVQIYSHGFQGPDGKWFIDNCPSTLGQPCPVCDANRPLYANKTEANKAITGARKRKNHYIANILVIKDPNHPENNGKVFRFKFGAKIFGKITDKVQPTFEDEVAINVFDLWEGANFKLRQCLVEKFPNYDKSSFEGKSAIADSDEEILAIVNQQVKLGTFIAPEKFKSYDALQTKFTNAVNGTTGRPSAPAKSPAEQLASALKETSRPVIEEKTPPRVAQASTPVDSTPDGDDADLEDYFKQIAND